MSAATLEKDHTFNPKKGGLVLIKAPSVRIFSIPEIQRNEDRLMHYCEFCAKLCHYYNDRMDQVICEPNRLELFKRTEYYQSHTPALRCHRCRAHGRTMTFNRRKIVHPSYGDLGEADSVVSTMPKRKVTGIHGWVDQGHLFKVK